MFINKKTLFTVVSIVLLGLIYIGILQSRIVQSNKTSVPQNADYLIVLGARVKGTVPSLVLKERINTAASYLKANKNTIAVASGGKGAGECVSEAENIKEELVKRGIEESRILLEDKSTDTYENILFSKKLIPKGMKTGIVVTNTFHLYRAVSIAKDYNLTIHGLPAKTPKSAIIKSYTREYLAITKYYIKRILS
jgi:uncharacterized SAM-binding protein YcdF (DUF218 family)